VDAYNFLAFADALVLPLRVLRLVELFVDYRVRVMVDSDAVVDISSFTDFEGHLESDLRDLQLVQIDRHWSVLALLGESTFVDRTSTVLREGAAETDEMLPIVFERERVELHVTGGNELW